MVCFVSNFGLVGVQYRKRGAIPLSVLFFFNMKIGIITNTFGQYTRQNVAVQSWEFLKKTYDDVKIYDFQFENEANQKEIYYPQLDTRFWLKTSSQDLLPNPTKKLPLVFEILMLGASLMSDADYLILVNSDVILMPRIIDHILKDQPKAFSSSRLDIEEISTLDPVLNKTIKPIRYECFGSDVFVFNVGWLRKHRASFEGDYLYGSWRWDNVYTAIIKLLGDAEEPLGMGFPPYAFHCHHGLESVMSEYPEKNWNSKILDKNLLHKLAFNIHSEYLKNVLNRQDYPIFLNPTADELEREIAYYSKFNIK